jgi:hypothetical protein
MKGRYFSRTALGRYGLKDPGKALQECEFVFGLFDFQPESLT